jgi:mevalonate kinase
MVRSVTATAPGRICLAGEDLDWIVGPAVLAAVNLRTTVTVSTRARSSGEVVLESGLPFAAWRAIPVSAMADYDGHVLDYARAAVVTMTRAMGLPIQPLTISITSQVPPASGLSSSAALIVATLGALDRYYGVGMSKDEICSIAYDVEAGELGTGAGQMDFYSCALGSVIYLDCSTRPPRLLERFSPRLTLRPVVIDTRIRHSTKGSIAAKRERSARSDPDLLRYVTETLQAVTTMREILRDDRRSHDRIGSLLLSCHEALREYMRVSTDLIDDCVQACMEAGAAGAKLTGSGLGGCLFAFVAEPRLERLVRALDRYPVDVYPTTIDPDGLVIAKSVS